MIVLDGNGCCVKGMQKVHQVEFVCELEQWHFFDKGIEARHSYLRGFYFVSFNLVSSVT